MQGSDVPFILEFLRQHDLKAAEEALRNELAAKGNLLSDPPVVKASGKVSVSGNGSISQLGLAQLVTGPAAPSIEAAIPQGLAPVRIHSSHDLLKAGEEPVEEKGKRKSVSDLSMVPPPLPIAEPITSPAISPPTHESSSGSIKHHNVPAKHKPQGSGHKNQKQPGAADGKAAGFKPTWARRESTEKGEPAEPTSLQQAREMLLGLAMGGDQASGTRPGEEEWDSDEYEDEDDVGYHRQAIEDEEAFLANEIETPPNEDEGQRTSAGGEGAHEKNEGIGDDPSFQEEAYFSGEEYYKLEGKPQEDDETSSEASVRELEQAQAKALSRQSSGLGDESAVVEVEDFGILTAPEGVVERQRPGEGDERARKKGLADLLQKLTAKPAERTSNGRPAEEIPGSKKLTGVEAEAAEAAAVLAQYEKAAEGAKRAPGATEEGLSGFSFPEPASVDIAPPIILETGGKSVWSVDNLSPARTDPEANNESPPLAMPDADDMLAGFLRKSNETSPVASPKEEVRIEEGQEDLDDDRGDSMHAEEGDDDIDAALEEGDEDAAVHEQLQRMKAEDEEFEVFDLRVIHRKNRTGFEEEKDFPVQLNAVVAGRYHVTEYLGSAAFSKAIQAHDLQTGMDVCMKIIKNNKDFFDQSLDEIKLLKYINKHDPADEHHILRLYDYFYHREHLFIVCELLRANLYEFHKYNRESGGEVYFTMARIQCITVQILEALNFLHGLGLLHCDLKPENILVKSYSRCEIKVIDLGSSCFATDHLCSYVQSRSYRAPEVILGLPYSHKIDIWSLGCILAELCSGTVLFQNDSLATLLARVVGILGPIDPAMLARGKDTHKYFTKANMLYERNQETDRLEYLIPKKTSLRHRLPTGDAGFTEFVSTLLETNPEKRPSAEEALRHPWLKFPYEPFN